MTIEEMLDQLYELKVQQQSLEEEKIKKHNEIITPEILEKLQELEDEFAPMVQASSLRIADLTSEVQKAVLAQGSTAKSQHFTAVWNSGKTSWDTKALNGVVEIIPELKKFRKIGDPYVVIREVKQK